MLHIIEDACEIAGDCSQGTVVVESDCQGPPFHQAFDELNDGEAKRFAMTYAATKGVAPAYLNGSTVGPYAVNSEGLPLEKVHDASGKQLSATHPRMQPKAYRLDVMVRRPLR